MKQLLMSMFCILLLVGCEKEDQIKLPSRTQYLGSISYNIPNVLQQTTSASRILYLREDQMISQWFSAPLVETVIVNATSYTITEVIWPGETWCDGKHIQTEIIFNGSGSIQGDSLIEQGTVCKRVTINDILKSSDTGTWSARFKRYSYSPSATDY